MEYGFECFDADTGLKIFEVTDRLTRFIGSVTGTLENPVTGSITIPSSASVNNNIFFILDVYLMIGQNRGQSGAQYNKVEISGNTITYTNLTFTMRYGVY